MRSVVLLLGLPLLGSPDRGSPLRNPGRGSPPFGSPNRGTPPGRNPNEGTPADPEEANRKEQDRQLKLVQEWNSLSHFPKGSDVAIFSKETVRYFYNEYAKGISRVTELGIRNDRTLFAALLYDLHKMFGDLETEARRMSGGGGLYGSRVEALSPLDFALLKHAKHYIKYISMAGELAAMFDYDAGLGNTATPFENPGLEWTTRYRRFGPVGIRRLWNRWEGNGPFSSSDDSKAIMAMVTQSEKPQATVFGRAVRQVVFNAIKCCIGMPASFVGLNFY
ncbi:MAG: uncharacterized protein KVP18_003441 [Porospora cf. gigantea A]|uniref:uncharacterized protein n=1 Tax=Porospora cf. gigantea A TaxID=2853593 RepID=UPI0035593EEA|nr:MAG: hypothetical protein KVP18_003441 [Porospora cf. gigantea A]